MDDYITLHLSKVDSDADFASCNFCLCCDYTLANPVEAVHTIDAKNAFTEALAHAISEKDERVLAVLGENPCAETDVARVVNGGLNTVRVYFKTESVSPFKCKIDTVKNKCRFV